MQPQWKNSVELLEEELCKKLMRRHHLRFVQPDIGYDHDPLSFLFDLICICISISVSVCICMRHHMFFVQLYEIYKNSLCVHPYWRGHNLNLDLLKTSKLLSTFYSHLHFPYKIHEKITKHVFLGLNWGCPNLCPTLKPDNLFLFINNKNISHTLLRYW